jgi:uroporphyrinogen decarboxylase
MKYMERELAMTSKERVTKTLNFETPDRVPVIANLTPQVAERLGKVMNLPYQAEDSFLSTRVSHTEILLELGNDAVVIGACRAKNKPTVILENGHLNDEWNLEYGNVGIYMDAVKRPLSEITSIEELNQYDFPDPHAEGRWELAEKISKKYKDDYYVVGDMEASLFELSWGLVGLDKFLIDLTLEEPYIFELMDRVQAYSIACGKKMIDLGADMLWTGDDFGTQRGMMISPQMWETYFKPRMTQMIHAFKTYKPEIKIAYHSCGSIFPIIEGLCEAGIDVLNPIQPAAMDMELGRLKELFGNRLAFFGGVDVQEVLPNGTVEEIYQEVQDKIRAGGDQGGYIIAPAHNIQPDTSNENVFAFFEAVKKFGTYQAL